MKKSELKNIIKEEIRTIIKEIEVGGEDSLMTTAADEQNKDQDTLHAKVVPFLRKEGVPAVQCTQIMNLLNTLVEIGKQKSLTVAKYKLLGKFIDQHVK